ncbi:MAG: septum formation initiator family protein [Epulopiscium sp.]|nr:septum formation initiator family protein [Candidatus Epulonipiscium sp.]
MPSLDPKKRKRKKKRAYRVQQRLLLLFLVLFLGAVTTKLYQLYHIYEDLEAEIHMIEQQIDFEKERQVLLVKEKDYYESDAYIEKIARERLGLIMPDEIIFVTKP